MIAINSNVRFPTIRALQAQAKQASFVKFKHAQDARGFYFTEVELHPTIVRIVEEQDARARESAAKRIATGADQADAPKAPKAPKHEGMTPITKQIRNWVHAHPGCTKIDALSAFPGVNPGTVGVQFGAAKRGVI